MKLTTKALYLCALILLPSLTHAAIPVNLKLKSTDKATNGAVTELQTLLGIYPTTGYYGTKTQVVLKAFQKKNKLPQTGTVNSATAKFILTLANPPVAAPLPTTSLAPIVEQPVVATTTWDRGTFQRVHIPAKILTENSPVSVRLLSRNAFKHDDIYSIGLGLPSSNTTFDWIVGSSTGQNNSTVPGQVPAGDYILQICALSCYEHKPFINIPKIVATKSAVAVMASLESEPIAFNYDIVGNRIIDENGTDTVMKNKVAYIGSEITVFTKTKTYSSVQSPIRIWAFANTGSSLIFATTSNARTFKFIIGETIQLPEGTYTINVCIGNECNFAREKLEIRKATLQTETVGKAYFTIPNSLAMYAGGSTATTSISKSYRDSASGSNSSLLALKVTVINGSADSSPYMSSGYTSTSVNGYTVYELSKSSTRIVKLDSMTYAVIEGRSVLIDYVVNSLKI